MDYTMQQMAFVIQAVVSRRPWCSIGDVAIALPLAPIRDLQAAVSAACRLPLLGTPRPRAKNMSRVTRP
jgi:hypothetical protein